MLLPLAQLIDERALWPPRLEAAEEAVRALQKERDTLLDDRARLQQEVSSLIADKRGLEELAKRLEAQVLRPLAAVGTGLLAKGERLGGSERTTAGGAVHVAMQR